MQLIVLFFYESLDSDKTKNKVIVWGLLQHPFPFRSLGTNIFLLLAEQVIRREEEEQTKDKLHKQA